MKRYGVLTVRVELEDNETLDDAVQCIDMACDIANDTRDLYFTYSIVPERIETITGVDDGL